MLETLRSKAATAIAAALLAGTASYAFLTVPETRADFARRN